MDHHYHHASRIRTLPCMQFVTRGAAWKEERKKAPGGSKKSMINDGECSFACPRCARGTRAQLGNCVHATACFTLNHRDVNESYVPAGTHVHVDRHTSRCVAVSSCFPIVRSTIAGPRFGRGNSNSSGGQRRVSVTKRTEYEISRVCFYRSSSQSWYSGMIYIRSTANSHRRSVASISTVSGLYQTTSQAATMQNARVVHFKIGPFVGCQVSV